MIDYIVIAILVVIVAAAAFYVYKAKKSGKKCIGCPERLLLQFENMTIHIAAAETIIINST